MDNNEKPQLNIEIKPEVAGGHYSNLAVISHSRTEFIIDFVFHHPAMPRANVQSRVVMSPVQAKRLMRLLEQNIASYEQKAGPITLAEDVSQNTPISPFKVN